MNTLKQKSDARSAPRSGVEEPRNADLPLASDGSENAPSGTQTLVRGLSVLDAVAGGARELREISLLTRTTRSTTHRLVSCLVQAGYLRLIPKRGYLLGPKLIELGYQARDEIPLSTLARPFIEELARTTGDTVHLGVRDEEEVLYLDKVSGTKGLEMRSRIGHRMPLATTGMGKALLLDLDESEWKRHYEDATRVVEKLPSISATRLGWETFLDSMRRYAAGEYAFDLEENEVSIRCVAAPIRDAASRIVAAVSVSSTIPYMPMKRMRELIAVVQRTASAISGQLGWQAAEQNRGARKRGQKSHRQKSPTPNTVLKTHDDTR